MPYRSGRPAALLPLLLLLVLASVPAAAQEDRAQLALRVGAIRVPGGPLYAERAPFALYPELALSFAPIALPGGARLGAGVYAGYWDDGEGPSSRCLDCVAYAQRSLLTGARLHVSTGGPLRWVLFTGFGRQFVHLRYIDGWNGPVPSSWRVFGQAEAGLRLQVPLRGPWSVEVQGLGLLPLTRENRPAQYAVTAGLGYTL